VARISDERIDQLLSEVGDVRNELRGGDYEFAAQLLEMVLLQVRLQRHNITSAEFSEFCHFLEWQQREKSTVIKLERRKS
jgi:hypothetical protein